MNFVLVLKLVLVPSLIAGVTLAGRRWGPAVAGWLSAFPVVAAPILFFIALEHGAEFTAHAAVGTLSAVLANVVFGLSYAHSAVRFSWFPSLLFGFAGFFSAVIVLTWLQPSLLWAAAMVLLVLLLAPRLYPTPAPSSVPRALASGNDIGVRMTAGALLVLLVTHFSASLGPQLSGVFAMFPVMGSVLTVFSHRQSGAAFAIQLLRGMVLGFFAFSTFCISLSLLLPKINIGAGFLLALLGAIGVQGVSRIYMQHVQTRAACR